MGFPHSELQSLPSDYHGEAPDWQGNSVCKAVYVWYVFFKFVVGVPREDVIMIHGTVRPHSLLSSGKMQQLARWSWEWEVQPREDCHKGLMHGIFQKIRFKLVWICLNLVFELKWPGIVVSPILRQKHVVFLQHLLPMKVMPQHVGISSVVSDERVRKHQAPRAVQDRVPLDRRSASRSRASTDPRQSQESPMSVFLGMEPFD